jgi:hypothetical protein
MANIQRALVALSDNLGAAINYSAQREHERVMAMRQENQTRLQHMLGEESRATERAYDQTVRNQDRTARKEELATEIGARREESAADRALRQQEGEADRSLRRSEGAADRDIQRERWGEEDQRLLEKEYLGKLTTIDQRIQDLTDYKVQANAEGKLVDNSYLSEVDSELKQLQEQKRSLAQERDIMLARGGDSRYRKLTPEEVAAIQKRSGPGGAVPNRDGAATPMAAQAPQEQTGGTSIKAPRAPPPAAPEKPEGMRMREERRGPANRAAIAGGAGQGARDIISAGRDIAGRVAGRRDEGPMVKQIKQALQSGQKPAPEQLQALAGIDRDRLTGVYGFSESDLQRLGL